MIFVNAITFFIIIGLGYSCKKIGMLTCEDGRRLGKVVMNITLPCALLSTIKQLEFGWLMGLIILFAIAVNAIMLWIGYRISKNKNTNTRAAYAVNTAGYNIGNFAIPFAQSMYDANALSYISMFDIGNSFMGLGINYSVATMIAYGDCNLTISDIIRKLCSSIPFDTYFIIFLLSLFQLQLPSVIVDITSRIGSANTFLSMFMVGLLLDFRIQKNEIVDVVKILSCRYGGAIILSLFTWYVFPAPVIVRQMLIIALCSPIISVAPLFSYYLGYKGTMPAMAGSFSMLISIFCLTFLSLLFA